MLLDRLESRTLLTSVLTYPMAYVQNRELVVLAGFYGAEITLTVSNGMAKFTARSGLESTPPQTYRQTFYSRKGTNFHSVRVELSERNDVTNITSDLPLTANGYGGSDHITISARNARVVGGDGDDTLVSSPPLVTNQPEQSATRVVGRGVVPVNPIDMIAPTHNRIDGNAGDDIIHTRGGDDEVHGGAGRDTLVRLNGDIRVQRGRPVPIAYAPEGRVVLKSRVGIFSVETIGAPVRSRPLLVIYNGGLEAGTPVSIFPVAPKKR